MTLVMRIHQNTSVVDPGGASTQFDWSNNSVIANSTGFRGFSETFGSETDKLIAFVLDVSAIQAFAMWITSPNTQTASIETNSSSSPAQTFLLEPNVPFIWQKAFDPVNPLTTDITALYYTSSNASSEFNIRCTYDSTPP